MLFGINSLYIWMAVIILCVAVEAFTLDLSAIWFAVGGVAALIAASLPTEISEASFASTYPPCAPRMLDTSPAFFNNATSCPR